MKRHPKKRARLLTCLFCSYLIALITITLVPFGKIEPVFLFDSNPILELRKDYLLHMMMYVPLPLLMRYSVMGKAWESAGMKARKIFWVAFVSLILAVSLEYSQLLVHYRTFNIYDLAGNAAGVMLGCLLIVITTKRGS